MKTAAPMNLTERQKTVVKAYADNNMSMAGTARALGCHWNSISYQLNRVYYKTGLDPFKFYDLVKLLVRIHDDSAKEGGTVYGRKRKT